MKKAFDDYTLLAGGSGLRGSLWQGPDHLLVIEGKGVVLPFSESYRRIDYKNIQAFTYARTTRMVWIMVLILFLLALAGTGLAFAISKLGNHPVTYLSGGVCAIFLALLAIHLWKGRTCRCALQTAVLSLRLKPLRREKKALQVLSQLSDICLRHQGGMSADAMAAHDANAPLATHGLRPLWTGSTVARLGFLLLVLWGVMLAGEMFVTSVPYLVTHIVLALTAVGMLIATLANAMRGRSPAGLVGVTWAALGNLALTGILGFILMMVFSIKASLNGNSDKPDFQSAFLSLAYQNLEHSGGLGWVVILMGLIGVGFGVAGLMLAGKRLAPEGTVLPAQMPANKVPPL